MVGGWIGVSLLLERRGERAPTLAEWLSPQPTGTTPTLTDALLTRRTMESLLTESDWQDMESWPAGSCEVAFVRNPRNVELMRLVDAVVGAV